LTAAVSDNDSDIDVPDAIPAKPQDPKLEEEEEDDDEEEEDEYQVEKIIEHKVKRGTTVYRIKWLGYEDEADQTWEPVENLYIYFTP
jgi:chromobox protein 1